MAEPTGILNGLSEIMDVNLIQTDPATLGRYSVDGAIPKAVVFPTRVEQVSDVVRFANQEKMALVPWGSGTKMAMGSPPRRLDLVVCTSRLNRLKDVDAANLTITAEAGVKFRDIQARLATEEDRCYLPLDELGAEEDEMICSERSHSGCFLPVDPPWSKRATIGGIVACNSWGPRRLLYGLPRDLVLGVRFVAPDGGIVGAGGKTVKNVSGYDVSKLMIGSMGTLGILCDITLRLLPLPERMETLLASFGAFPEASAFARSLLETKLLPAAVEVMNGQAARHMEWAGAPDLRPGDFVVAVALEAFEEAVTRMRSEMGDMADRCGSRSRWIIQEEEHLRFWLSVSGLIETLTARHPDLVASRLNYPISRWDSIVRDADGILNAGDIPYALIAHAGNGVSVLTLLPDHAQAVKVTDEALNQIRKVCREAGGNFVLEKASPERKASLPVWGEPGQDWAAMKRIKEKLDPSGVLSPGRFLGNL
jgi:glycolate dehydrogenase FAD-binding subunit